MNKEFLKRHYALQKHPEGGSFHESYRAALSVETEPGARSASTAIYFLLEEGDFSAFHRIEFDEMWHFYEGGPLRIVEITSSGELKETLLGRDVEAGERFQHVVPGGTWFASQSLKDFSWVGCTVAPGFDFKDFALAERSRLTLEFPQHRALIEQFTRL